MDVYEGQQFICTQCGAELDESELDSVVWEDDEVCPYCFGEVYVDDDDEGRI